MYSQQQKPAFGQASTGSFAFPNTSATLQPFGQSFGKPTTSTFGQTSAFGQQNTSLFGSNQSTGTSLFGAGSSTAFGSTTNPQTTFGGFSQPSQNTSLFGTPQQSTAQTSFFGQSSTSAFGAAKPTGFGGFGQTQPTTSLFGQSNTVSTPATGFGTFGQNPSGGVFGSTQPAFGQNTIAGATGTALVKYQPSIGTDTFMKNGTSNNVNTKQHCITAMKEYENKSLEELRMEDYLANRKGPQGGATSGLFGQTQPGTGSVFGSTATQQTTGLFGQQPENKNLFGTSSSLGGTGFGQTNTPAFGQTNQTSAGLFGKTFATPASSSAGFGFGSNLFGQTTQATGFGQQSASFGGFGTTTQAQPSLFGNTTTDNKTPFGLGTSTSNTGFGGFGTNTNTSTSAGGLFGNKPATGFGTGAGFGTTTSTATGFGNFGNTGSFFNNTLNKPATSAFGGFGTQPTAPLGGGLNFGAGGSSIFGNTANKPGGSLFGNTGQGTGTSLFGTGSTFGAPTNLSGFGSNPLTSSSALGSSQQQNAFPIHQQIIALTTSPYGENSIFKDLKLNIDESETLKPTNPAAHKPILETVGSQFKVSNSNANGVKVRPLGSALTKKSMFEGLEEHDSSLERSFTLKTNHKRLILKPKDLKNSNVLKSDENLKNITKNSQDNEDVEGKRNDDIGSTPSGSKSKKDLLENDLTLSPLKLKGNSSYKEKSWNLRRRGTLSMDNTMSELIPKASSTCTQLEKSQQNVSKDDKSKKGSENEQIRQSLSNSIQVEDVSSNDNLYVEDKNGEVVYDDEPHPTGIILQRPGYYTIPSLDELLEYLSEDGSCVVPHFTIGRHGYGNVCFNGPLDVSGLNLDEIVHFRNKEIILYPDDENKPPVGSGLNREAQITLDQVWPQDKTLHEPITDPERLAVMNYEGKLRKVCDKHDTRFVEYRPETGSWVFRVKHFSKYGLNDSDEEDVPTDSKKPKMTPKDQIAKDQEKVLAEQKLTLSKKQQVGPTSSNNVELAQIKDSRRNDDFEYFDASSQRKSTSNVNDYTGYFVNPGLIPKSPTETLAEGSGMDPHKLQMMKASFFIDDDVDSKSIASESIDGRCTPDQTVPNRPFLRTREHYSSNHSLIKDVTSSKSMFDYGVDSPSYSLSVIEDVPKDIEIEPTPISASFPKYEPLIVKPKVAPKKITNFISYEKLIGEELKGKCLSDMALFNLRRFKVGFGPQNNLLLLNSVNKKMKIFHSGLNFDKMLEKHIHPESNLSIIHNIKINSMKQYDNFEEKIKNHLKIQLNHSLKVEVDDSDCPFIKSSKGTELITEHLAEAVTLVKFGDYEVYVASIWCLCQSLWGEQPELEGQNPSSHLYVMQRKSLFSEWLENEFATNWLLDQQDDAVMKPSSSSKNTYLENLFDLITRHRIYEACELAFKNDDANLSLLLSQISGGPTIRQLIQHQLTLWQNVDADKFIAVERLKIFMLIAGISLMSSTSHGAINVLEGIPWLKALAMHMWYLCSPTSSITDALLEYEKSFTADEFYSLSPLPPYYEKCEIKRNDDKPLYDLKYHILKLYSKRSHPMESLLNPATHTDDPMDYRLSWLLLQTMEALGYHHCSELSESQLHVSFANQLENNGMWHWSVFVLLHIKNREQRELSVQEALYRYVSLSNASDVIEKEKFIINDLGVPQKWIHWAKAVKAGISRNYRLQVDYLLKAKQFSLAHEIIMEHIAPDAIINDKIQDLYQLLIQFENQKSKKLTKVHNWANQGQILLDYIEMDEKFKKLKNLHESDVETRWESLKPQLADLCSRINLLPCPTAKHRLCQSEISQKLACLVRGIILTCPILNPCLLIKIALEKLPLPQEYAKQELRVLLDAFIDPLVKTNSIEDVEKIEVD